MKFKTFRILVVGGLVAVIGTGTSLYVQHAAQERSEEESRERAILAEAQSRSAAEAVSAAVSGAGEQGGAGGQGSADGQGSAGSSLAGQAGNAGSADGLALRELDEQILSRVHGTASSPKVKDALGRGGPKVNLYADDGSGYYNRVKIDFNRNEKWEEKWTLEKGEVVKRQVAPADDDKYTEEYTLKGRRWVKEK